jgi:ribonuclease P protein component
VVSKKVAKSAPVRNTIRRRLYEQIRLQAPSYLRNHDVVITIFDPELETVDAAIIERLVGGILKDIIG